MTQNWEPAALKWAMRPASVSNPAIKGHASKEPSDGLYPAFSASGQDVWLPEPHFRGPGLVLSAVGARCGKVFKADGDWGVVANTSVFIPQRGFDRDFLWYLVNDESFWDKGGTAQPYVRVAETLSRRIPMPDQATQRRIAAFLDTETARIDALIEAKRSQADLLRERLGSLAEATLLTGSDERSPVRLRHACTDIFLGLTSKVDYVQDGGVPLVRALDIAGGTLRLDRALFISETQHGLLTRRRAARRNDILLSKSGSIGQAAIVETDEVFSVYESIFVLRPNPSMLLPRYLLHLLRTPWCQFLFTSRLTGMGVAHLNMSDIVDIEISLPGVEEQRSLVEQMDAVSNGTHGIAVRLARQAALLVEYRQALITAAVTDQLDEAKR